MLKPISRLRSICKGDLNIISYYSKNNIRRIRKNILHSIPVLSIFVLLGIMAYSTIVISPSNMANLISLGLGESNGEVYAADASSTSSLIIDNGNLDNVSNTTEGNITYSSHTVKVNASNITGYALTITGPEKLEGATEIKGANNNTPTNMPNNTWGYGWNTETTANTSMSYKSFTGSAQNLETNTSLTNNTVDLTKKLVFAAKFGDNAMSGHYRANVTLSLNVTPRQLITYSVTYNANGGTGTTPTTQTYSTYDISATLYTANHGTLAKSGYDFTGWAESASATVPTYTAGSPINLAQNSSTKTLYAVWTKSFDSSLINMQGMSATICQDAGIGAQKTLTDTRDGKTYTIRKLADGNCWMVDNLALDLSVKGIATTAASDNLTTDFPSEALLNRYDTTSTNAWISSYGLAQFSKSPQKINSNYPGDSKGHQSSYGYYYSWYAATATTIVDNAASGDASGSICPKGWRLPKGGSSGDFEALYDKWTTATWTAVNSINGCWLGASTAAAGGAYFPAAGFVNSDGLSSGGAIGNYWSRTVNDGYSAYYLRFFNGVIAPAYQANKYLGNSVRCVAYSS